MKCIVNDGVVFSRPLEGPLSGQVSEFAKWTLEGYAFRSRRQKVLLAARFSRWLGQQAVSARQISSEHSTRYLRSRAGHLKVQRDDAATLRQFLDFLRRRGVVPAEKTPPPQLTPVERTVLTFKRYLRDERILAEASIVRYVPFVRKFLADRFGDGPVRLSLLRATDVVRFVLRQASRLHLKRAKLLTSALRSFLHYARYLGQVRCDLAAAVPTVANWSMPSIPRAIPAYRDGPPRLRDPAVAGSAGIASGRGGETRTQGH